MRGGTRKRTALDRTTDLRMFLTSARIHMVRAITPAELATRYGVDAKVATYEHTIALQRRAAE